MSVGVAQLGKKATHLPTYFFLRFFDIFRSDFGKYFCGVFYFLMQRNGQKRDKKQIERKKMTQQNIPPQLFCHFFVDTFSSWEMHKSSK
jgi:hypothetical protein